MASPVASRPRLNTFSAIFASIVLLAFMARIWNVGARPMHLDESTVAWFAWQLLTGHGYSYDPVYHGPFQHEMLALIFLLFEPSQTSARMLAVVLGTGIVALPFFLQDYLGRVGVLVCSFLLAISPSFVYFGRFERDDTYMEFFTFLLVVFVLRFIRDRRPWQVYGAAVAFALAFTTKESIYIVMFIFGTFLVFYRLGSALASAWLDAETGRSPKLTSSKPVEPPDRLPLKVTGAMARAVFHHDGSLTGACLILLGSLLAAALLVTPPTRLYLPVPLVMAVIIALSVIGAGLERGTRATQEDRTSDPDREPDPRQDLAADRGQHRMLHLGEFASRPGSEGENEASGAGMHSFPQPEDRSRRWSDLRTALTGHWLNAATIGLAIVVLMYSTFGTDLDGLWDRAHPLFNTGKTCPYTLALGLDACRRDVLGGLLYWLSQHKVARGGQPWFYYLLIYGLYEQVALLLGGAAAVRTVVSRALPSSVRATRVFFTYWAVLAVGVYSWAGEKFPWLGIHPLLPLTILAGIGISDLILFAQRSLTAKHGAVAAQGSRMAPPSSMWPRTAAVLGLTFVTALLILTIHNSYVLNYVDGANPVEMMVYVQSSPDTIDDADRIDQLSNRVTNGPALPVTIDAPESWPFAWYLRNMPNVAYPAGSQAVRPPYVDNPIVILDESDALTYPLPSSLTSGYSRTSRRLDWWFPEDYKAWSWTTFGRKATQPSSWTAIWRWEIWREPFGPRDGTWYYLYVKKRYFPAF